jgi:hypothetical protein
MREMAAVLSTRDCKGWDRGIFGKPPSHAYRTLKFDPETRVISLVGDYFFGDTRPTSKWSSGAVAPDGSIYCIPFNSNQVLSIAPLREFAMSIRTNMKLYPQELRVGRLFVTYKNEKTVFTYQCAVTNVDRDKICQIIEDCVPSHVVCAGVPIVHSGSFM